MIFIIYFFLLHSSPIHAAFSEDRDYTYLYLYNMDLSDEVKSSIDDFMSWYSKEVNPYHYLELTICEVRIDSPSLYFRIDFCNSLDKGRLVINDEYYKSDWFVDSHIIGFSLFNGHWIIVRAMYGVANVYNGFIKLSQWPFVMRFMLWRHDGFVHPPGVVNDGLYYRVKENDMFRYPQRIEE